MVTLVLIKALPNFQPKHPRKRNALHLLFPIHALPPPPQQNGNVTGDGEKLQDPTHCPTPTNATALAQEGTRSGLPSTAVRRPRRSRRRLRRHRMPAVHRPRHVPEPSDLQEAALAGRGGIRLRYSWSSGASVRRIGVRRGSPSRGSLRVESLVENSESQGSPEAMRRRHQKEPRVFRRI